MTQQPATETTVSTKASALAWLRLTIVTGALVTAPAVITLYILYLFITTLDGLLIGVVPASIRPESLLGYPMPGTGLIAGVVLMLIVGILVRNYFGRRLVMWGERLMSGIPGVRSIYGAIKQVIETVSKAGSTSFREVVLVEYPRKGLWCLAFVTGKTKGQAQKLINKDVVNIFLPTTPNPTSGFLLFVPREDLVSLDMTVEQGLKMVISGGIVTPSTAEGKAALKEEKNPSIEEITAS